MPDPTTPLWRRLVQRPLRPAAAAAFQTGMRSPDKPRVPMWAVPAVSVAFVLVALQIAGFQVRPEGPAWQPAGPPARQRAVAVRAASLCTNSRAMSPAARRSRRRSPGRRSRPPRRQAATCWTTGRHSSSRSQLPRRQRRPTGANCRRGKRCCATLGPCCRPLRSPRPPPPCSAAAAHTAMPCLGSDALTKKASHLFALRSALTRRAASRTSGCACLRTSSSTMASCITSPAVSLVGKHAG